MMDLRSKVLYSLESSRKDLSFDAAFVSVAPLFTELDRGAKNAPPGCGGWDYPPGPAGLKRPPAIGLIINIFYCNNIGIEL